MGTREGDKGRGRGGNNFFFKKNKKNYLRSNNSHSIPFQAGEDIDEEGGVVGGFDLVELDVAAVEREGERGGFAGFDGAGEEVEGEEFHCLALFSSF